MLNENAKKWVAALRSGEYEQGKGLLCRNGKYCCLGVLCDLYANEHPEFIKITSNSGIALYGEDEESAGATGVVRGWVGLRDSLGHFSGGALFELNDCHNKTFAEIADIIESEPEGLFVKEVA